MVWLPTLIVVRLNDLYFFLLAPFASENLLSLDRLGGPPVLRTQHAESGAYTRAILFLTLSGNKYYENKVQVRIDKLTTKDGSTTLYTRSSSFAVSSSHGRCRIFSGGNFFTVK